MNTQFIDPIKKFHLQIQLKNGSDEAISLLMGELQRLESIIRTYEIALEQSADKLKSDTFKKPHSTLQ